ncbi:hypothetical protein ACHAQH_003015 [Verticillium albo-atrum]
MPYRQIVSRAPELGVNGFDTSPYYGPSEDLLGDALHAHVAAHSTPRESYVLVTKAGRIGPKQFDYSPNHVRYSIMRSLQRLRTTYLDLVYLHNVEFVSPMEVLEAIETLRQLQLEGFVRYVGISGFPVETLCSLAKMVLVVTGEPLDAVLTYGHFTIQNPILGFAEIMGINELPGQQSLLQRFRDAQVGVVLNASMLGMGLLTQTGICPANGSEAEHSRSALIAKWHPSPTGLRVACRGRAQIAAQNGRRLEDIALRWSMEEFARIGALGGLGVEFPGRTGKMVGGSVMGVTTLEELEQTVDLWGSICQGLGLYNNDQDVEADSCAISKRAVEELQPALPPDQIHSNQTVKQPNK